MRGSDGRRIEIEVQPTALGGGHGVGMTVPERDPQARQCVLRKPICLLIKALGTKVDHRVRRAPERHRMVVTQQAAQSGQRVSAERECPCRIAEREEVAGQVGGDGQ